MSLLTQFYPSGGSSSYVGTLGTPGVTLGLDQVFDVDYSPFSGWYYLVTNIPTADYNANYTGTALWGSRDGVNFSLGTNINSGNPTSAAFNARPDGDGWVTAFVGSLNPGSTTGLRYNPGSPAVGPGAAAAGSPTGAFNFVVGSAYYDAGNVYSVGGRGTTPLCYYSTNLGVTWNSSPSFQNELAGAQPQSYSPRGNSGEIYVGAAGGSVIKSSDGGVNWTSLTPLPSTSDNLSVVAGAEGTGVLVSANGYYSTNDGLTWQSSGGWPGGYAYVVYNAASNRFVGFGTYTVNGASINFAKFSTDGGATWQSVSDPELAFALGSAGRYAVGKFNTNLYYVVSVPTAAGMGSSIAVLDPATLT